MMARPPSTEPTDGELELLNFLWDHGPAELRLICAALQQQRKVANTTVATMLGVMLEKGLVERRSGARGYQWSAAISRQTATKGLVVKLLDRVFDGSAQRLVTHLLETADLSDRDRAEIESLLRSNSDARSKRKGARK